MLYLNKLTLVPVVHHKLSKIRVLWLFLRAQLSGQLILTVEDIQMLDSFKTVYTICLFPNKKSSMMIYLQFKVLRNSTTINGMHLFNIKNIILDITLLLKPKRRLQRVHR